MGASNDIPVCILAGGGSRRFGSNKALAKLNGRPLIAHVIGRLAPQTDAAIAVNCKDEEPFADFELPIVEDRKWVGEGPLSGIFAALNWAKAQGQNQIATIAVDLPVLPTGLLEALSSAGAPSIAASGERKHPVIGLWATSQIKDLDQYLGEGGRSAHGWAEACEARIVRFGGGSGAIDPFYNINTAADLDYLIAHPDVAC